MAELIIRRESWPIAGTFTISRGAKTTADVVVVELEDGDVRGRGECVPYPRYDETVDGVVATIESLRRPLVDGLDRASLQNLLPAGAARNAVDCALWDLEARHKGMAVWQLAGLTRPEPVETAFTLSLDTAPNMAAAARRHRHHSLLKIKLSGRGDLERVAAVRENAPDSRLILDANESWSAQMVEPHSNALARMDISLLEQPLPAADDDLLAEVEHGVPICADESCHTTADLRLLVGKYDAVNIKLDKAVSDGLNKFLPYVRAKTKHGFLLSTRRDLKKLNRKDMMLMIQKTTKKHLGKNIGIQLIRVMKTTERLKAIDESTKLQREMGHDAGMQRRYVSRA